MPQKPQVVAFIQARMSSERFPGKVLADLNGRPVIDHVIARVARVVPRESIVVATSSDSSDDILARHLEQTGVNVYRGPLENVFERFRQCLVEYPCDWFVRVSADSPMLDSGLIAKILPYCARDDLDLVTNVFPRTFPKGQSVELISAAAFAKINSDRFSDEDREHVTKIYYRCPQDFRILNVESSNPDLARMNFSVDTPEDLERIKKIMTTGQGMPRIEIKTA